MFVNTLHRKSKNHGVVTRLDRLRCNEVCLLASYNAYTSTFEFDKFD